MIDNFKVDSVDVNWERQMPVYFFGSYETSDVEPIQLENETNQQAVQQLQDLVGQPINAPTITPQGLSAEAQGLFGQGQGILNSLLNLAKNPPEIYKAGVSSIKDILSGSYNPLTSPYYEGFRQASQIEEEQGVADIRRRGQLGGGLYSEPAERAESGYRKGMGAERLKVAGSLYESERNRMSNAINQALGYAQYQPNVLGKAMSGVNSLYPYATYETDWANKAAMQNASNTLQANIAGRQSDVSALGALSDYGTYYTPQQYYQPGIGDYLLGGLGAVGGLK